MKYDLVVWFFLAILTVCIVGYTIYVIYATISTSIRKEDVKEKWEFWINIFWTNTAMGWMWRELFGKKKAKQAPPHFSTGNSNSMYINPQNYITAKKAAPRGFLTIPTPPPISSYNTSSLNMGNKIGKPLVIKNWDRLAGMKIPMLTNSLGYSTHNWIVTYAGQTTDGYECILENDAFGNSNRALTFTLYSDMYDSHRVLVKCGGRISTMDIGVFKDPHNMLYRIANEFNEKFRV